MIFIKISDFPIFKMVFSIALQSVISFYSFAQPANSKYFKHHVVEDSLEGPQQFGTGGFTLADFDKDGDLDITISMLGNEGPVFWYENKSRQWQMHRLGTSDQMQLGGVTIDVDKDSYPDLVMGRYWFKNPGTLRTNPDEKWQKLFYNGGLDFENHDMCAADINLDGSADVISYSQEMGKGELRWYDIRNPMQWVAHSISGQVNELVKDIPGSNGIHGGFAPKGVGDLNGDQFPDIVLPTGWYKNPANSQNAEWQFMQWPFRTGVIPNPYGLSFRSWITDLDADGDNDVVYTDCDGAYSGGHWIENKSNRSFVKRELPSPPDSTGSFHSLGVADFDNDGDLDIVSGEQEDPDPGMKPVGLKERGFIWINIGTRRSPSFEVRIFHTDNPGWHEAQIGDVDGDGDMDIVSKIWNKDDGNYHLDFWENVIKQ
jgi:hypothetical protein